MSDRRAFRAAVAAAACLLTFAAAVAQDFDSVSSGASATEPAGAAAGAAPVAPPVIAPAAAPNTPVASQDVPIGSVATAAASGVAPAAAGTSPAVLPVAAAAAISGGPFAGSGSGHFELADRVVVRKSTRKLLLMRGGHVVAEYPVRLGLNPVGPKQREGDFRTPEGSYWLARRNQSSDFFLSIEVSYPNDGDRSRARRLRLDPGGSIMIHGQPNFPRKPADYYVRNDWTDGCIAVSNSDMVDIWLRTRVGLPIEIRP
jgi:hypothetical protein